MDKIRIWPKVTARVACDKMLSREEAIWKGIGLKLHAGEEPQVKGPVDLKRQQIARFQVNAKDSFSRQMVEDQTCAKVKRPCAKVSAGEVLDERPVGEDPHVQEQQLNSGEAEMCSQFEEEAQGAQLAC